MQYKNKNKNDNLNIHQSEINESFISEYLNFDKYQPLTKQDFNKSILRKLAIKQIFEENDNILNPINLKRDRLIKNRKINIKSTNLINNKIIDDSSLYKNKSKVKIIIRYTLEVILLIGSWILIGSIINSVYAKFRKNTIEFLATQLFINLILNFLIIEPIIIWLFTLVCYVKVKYQIVSQRILIKLFNIVMDPIVEKTYDTIIVLQDIQKIQKHMNVLNNKKST